VTQRLPLFPLGTVLFPGLVLPLHIFEERYRRLVRELRKLPEGPQRRFGVVAIRQGHEVGESGARALYEIGCTAEVHTIHELPEGRFQIVASGTRRFRLHEVDTVEAYPCGEVEFLPDVAGADAQVPALAVNALFLAYQHALRGLRRDDDAEGVPTLPSDPLVLSYLVAAAMVLDLPEKQTLLAQTDAAARLRAESVLLRRENHLIPTLRSLPAVDLTRADIGLN
jgi:Lon protease-like protein